jgi:hypothetical protein
MNERTNNPETQLQQAEQMAAYWLYLGNRAVETGRNELAERHFERSQKWHDKMNALLGNK